jgi:hypothetical protein
MHGWAGPGRTDARCTLEPLEYPSSLFVVRSLAMSQGLQAYGWHKLRPNCRGKFSEAPIAPKAIEGIMMKAIYISGGKGWKRRKAESSTKRLTEQSGVILLIKLKRVIVQCSVWPPVQLLSQS